MSMENCKMNKLKQLRDELNYQILAFEIRGVPVEWMPDNQFVPNAKVLLETLMSDLKGIPTKDVQDLCGFTTIAFSHMKNQDDFMALSIWCTFTFLLDDFLECQTTELGYWVRKWEQNIKNGRSYGTDFLDLFFNELRARMNKVLSEKLILSHNLWFMTWLNCHIDSLKAKNGDHIYTIDEYDAIRTYESGYPIMQMFLLRSIKFDPDDYPGIVTDDAWTMFNTWATRHFYYVNDLYSSKKEILMHQGKYTLIYMIMCQYKCEAQTASNKLVAMIAEAWIMVIEYGDKLRQHNIPLLHKYIDDIMIMLKGNIYWSSITPRYNKLPMYDNYPLQ